MKLLNSIAIPPEIVEFYRNLTELQETIARGLSSNETPLTKVEFSRGEVPLISYGGLRLNRDQLSSALRQVDEVLYRHRPQFRIDLEALENKLLNSEEDLVALVEKVIWQDSEFITRYVKKQNLNGELLSLVLFNVAKPFMTNYAKSLNMQFKTEQWAKNYCPICGWKPVFAVTTGEDKRRMLHCSLCDTEWQFKNLKCTHCLNENHETLGYVSVEDDEAHKVNFCDQCQGYIKTIDESKLISKQNAVLTDINTLHLDILSQREGYKKEIDMVKPEKTN